MKLVCVVLAAGLGTRMNSTLPKVLHPLSGVPMLQYVLDTLHALKPLKIVVVAGKHSAQIKKSLCMSGDLSFAIQREAKGTGDAVLTAIPFLRGFQGTALVVNGDAPLITKDSLKKFLLLHSKRGNSLSLISFKAGNPASYGRIIRNMNGHIAAIIEDRDASASQKTINEVNSGVYAIEPEMLPLIREIPMNRKKKEYYLTDLVGIARSKGMNMEAFSVGTEAEFIGINTPGELENARQILKDRIIRRWKDKGIHFLDSRSVFLSGQTALGRGTVIYPNVHIEGSSKVGRECTLYPNVRIVDSVIGDGSVVRDSTLVEGSCIAKGVSIGPFAHIRPLSEICEGARIGNFVEVKKSVIGPGTKAMHLSYIGDAKIGRGVNIGAGTITCNYDGKKKRVTVIEDEVFIGSDSQLVAPVRIARGAYVGAGSTITEDVPSHALALSRIQQRHVDDWALKKQLKVKSKKVKGKTGKEK